VKDTIQFFRSFEKGGGANLSPRDKVGKTFPHQCTMCIVRKIRLESSLIGNLNLNSQNSPASGNWIVWTTEQKLLKLLIFTVLKSK